MAKLGKSRKNDSQNIIGKGKITPVQVAFIVDRYLADNNFSKTRNAFREEASSLIPKSSLQEAPKTLLSLAELLDDYVWLKEQRVMIEHEKLGLAQERTRIQNLLQGMQDLMNIFNNSPVVPANYVTSPPPHPVSASVPPNSMVTSSSAGYPGYRTAGVASVSMSQSVKIDQTSYSTPILGSRPPRKRKNYKDLQNINQAPKKYCGAVTNNPLYIQGTNSSALPNNASQRHHINHQSSPLPSSSPSFAQGGSHIQGSNVARTLFDKHSSSPNSNSSCPKTPPRALSSHSDKSISPLEEVSSTAKSNHESTTPETKPNNCTIISSKTIIVSPAKHFSIETNQCTFSSPVKTTKWQSKREHVKGRLDFDSSEAPTILENTSGDGSTSSESEKEGDIFDLEVPGFDAFGPDFSISEFLTDLGIDCGSLDNPCPTTEGTNEDTRTSQNLVEHSSAVREVIAGDVSINGTDSITSIKSITQCVRVLSPTKCLQNNSTHDQENLSSGR
ncbi:uncharacterized protein LOC130823679 isoform X2 [Amaranthus tricolor]|uniref:uncharacterized protein LOC130823679 isoform X2 n=1 Tax=Amaranthus tricolor TaxID=29722 RepID=UPI002583B90D|nr:uncharacterized protein LOC130823679 isoform X2 [Amaranthus tricolor]